MSSQARGCPGFVSSSSYFSLLSYSACWQWEASCITLNLRRIGENASTEFYNLVSVQITIILSFCNAKYSMFPFKRGTRMNRCATFMGGSWKPASCFSGFEGFVTGNVSSWSFFSFVPHNECSFLCFPWCCPISVSAARELRCLVMKCRNIGDTFHPQPPLLFLQITWMILRRPCLAGNFSQLSWLRSSGWGSVRWSGSSSLWRGRRTAARGSTEKQDWRSFVRSCTEKILLPGQESLSSTFSGFDGMVCENDCVSGFEAGSVNIGGLVAGVKRDRVGQIDECALLLKGRHFSVWIMPRELQIRDDRISWKVKTVFTPQMTVASHCYDTCWGSSDARLACVVRDHFAEFPESTCVGEIVRTVLTFTWKDYKIVLCQNCVLKCQSLKWLWCQERPVKLCDVCAISHRSLAQTSMLHLQSFESESITIQNLASD